MKLIDAIGLALIICGAAMTALCFLVKSPETKILFKGDIISIPHPDYLYDYRYRRAYFLTTESPPAVTPTPYRMADWAQCMDGTQIYLTNPQFPTEPPAEPPCTKHGGLRAYGPGKRLNEK